MHTDNDLEKKVNAGPEGEEEGREQGLQWLIDMDLSEPEETLFTVTGDEYQDQGLSAFEAEVAGRPLVRGNTGGDDLANYVDEEIVISSEGASDIFTEADKPDDAEAEERRPEVMAIDYSLGRSENSGEAVGSWDEGADILGLQHDDDIGETYLTIKKVKGARGESDQVGNAQATESVQNAGADEGSVASEVTAEQAGESVSAMDSTDQAACASQADEMPEVQLADAPVPSQIVDPDSKTVANEDPEQSQIDTVSDADPLRGAQSLADAARLLGSGEDTDNNVAADNTAIDTIADEFSEAGDDGFLGVQDSEIVVEELDAVLEASEFGEESSVEDDSGVDLVEAFEAFGEDTQDTIDFPDEFGALEGVNDADAVAVAAIIPTVIEVLGAQVAARAADLGLAADAVSVDVMMGMDEVSTKGCYAEGYQPLAAVCAAAHSALPELSDTQAEAIYVRLNSAATQENWNHFFEPDFQAVQSVETPIHSDPGELEQFAAGEEQPISDDIFGADFTDELSDDFAVSFASQDDSGADIDAVFAEISNEEEAALAESDSGSAGQEFGAGDSSDEMPEFTPEEVSLDSESFDLPAEPEAVDEEGEDATVEAVGESKEGESAVEVEPVATEEEPAPETEAAESAAPEVSDEVTVETVDAAAEPDVAALAAMVGATDDTNPNWFAPEAITFNYTTQSNAEIFADFLDAFIEEGAAEIEKLENLIGEWEKDVTVDALYADVCRTLHTVKGIAKGVGLQRMGTLVHNFETLLEGLPRPVADEEVLYFRVVNVWLDAVVRGIEHITSAREDIQSELPQIGASAKAKAAEAAAVGEQGESSIEKAAAKDKAKAPTKKTRARKKSAARKKKAEPVSEEKPAQKEVQVSMLSALEKKRDKQLADEGAKVLAAQQSVRMTSEKLDLLLNLASQAQQLGVRASQNTSRSKRSSAELQGRLSSVRTHINKIADRALFNVNARAGGSSAEMDALEMDQYSELQEAASILREGVEDLSDLIDVVSRQNAHVEALLKQQSSVISSISSSIQGARVVPVSRLMPGLRRIVRTVSTDLGKSVTFNVLNETGALDRDHYARLQTVLEHMVRNALDHGIESADDRLAAGKPMGGRITIDVRKSGGDYIIRLSDDGKGIDADAIRQSAYEKGLDIDVDELTDDEAIRLIFHKGFSTATELSEVSGRGVGMDIVLTELQQIGGDISIQSAVGLGTSFEVRIPSNVSVNGALLVAAADQSYAIPLNGLVAVEQVPVDDFFNAVEQGRSLTLFDLDCEPAYLGTLCHSVPIPDRTFWDAFVPVIIAGANDRHMAIAIDNVEEALELVVRSLGSQFSTVPGVAGAATTADGEALVALDLNLLVASIGADGVAAVGKVEQEEQQSLLALVVDDSRTQRMVATSQLETVGVETVTAENGLVAIDLLNSTHRLPDVVLLDVEMPVKDGIETLREIRKSRRYGHLPVIMVTSRTGAKHRALAKDAGCNAYMGKPFNFPALIEQISELTGQELQLS